MDTVLGFLVGVRGMALKPGPGRRTTAEEAVVEAGVWLAVRWLVVEKLSA